MQRLEENVQVQSGVAGFVLLEHAGDDRPWETGLVPDKTVGLCRQRPGNRFFGRRTAAFGYLPTSNRNHVRGKGDVDRRGKAIEAVRIDRKPTAGVEKIAGIISNRRQLQTLNWAVIG